MTNEPRTLSIDRRTLLGGFAAALVAPRHGFAATATDATGRTIAAPDRVTRVYPAGPPAAVLLYTLAPDLLIGWLEPLGAAEREFLLPGSRGPAASAAAHRPRRRCQPRGGQFAQARSHRRRRHGERKLQGACRNHAATDRHSLRAVRRPLRADRADLPRAGRTRRPRRGSGKTRALCRRHDDDRQGAQRRRAERRAAARLLRPRQERPADRPQAVR